MGYPEPEPGLVISYSYLWSEEAAAGHAEGRKNRPCAILLVVQIAEGEHPIVTAAPITHSPPDDPGIAIEIPTRRIYLVYTVFRNQFILLFIASFSAFQFWLIGDGEGIPILF